MSIVWQIEKHGLLKVGRKSLLYTDCTERTEFFRVLTEEAVLSVLSMYKESVLAGFLEKAIIEKVNSGA